jgi:hypothetical protein
MLRIVLRFASCLLLLLGVAVGCGDSSGGADGTGGNGGKPPAERSSYRLGCGIDTLNLELPIELSFALDRPYTAGGSANLAAFAAITFGEQAVAMLIDAGITKIDIFSVEISPWIRGATPPTVETSLAAAPINDFDLEVDTDDNGIAGPHRLELETATIRTAVAEGAEEVELGLGLEQLSLQLGNFQMPTDCLGPTLVGFSARFPVEPVAGKAALP